jgi:transposase
MRTEPPDRIELEWSELESIIECAKSALSAVAYEKLKAAIQTLAWLTGELEKQRVSLARLRKFLFGTKKTEKASKVLNKERPKADGAEQPQSNAGDSAEQPQNNAEEKGGEKAEKKKPKGHGRNGADAYTGAEWIKVPHESLKPGDVCSECEKGKVYPKLKQPHKVVHVTGQAPVPATVHECEILRCNLCGQEFQAEAPPEAEAQKYAESAVAMMGLLKYGYGMPFNRLAKLQANLGIPLPATTQWDYVKKGAEEVLGFVYEELTRQAAQGQVVYNDDTAARILELMKENEEIEEAGTNERTGIFTSGIVATTSESRQIALFFTGRKHAGENLADVLSQRDSELGPPIQMCDGLSRNLPKEFETLLANCLAHGRRHFVDIVDNFPAECHYMIEILAEVYKNDAITREQEMSDEERLRFHQEHSAGLMADLKCWMTEQLEEKKVEPNSPLGEAFSYMLKRWDKLTLFLRVPGAPLDNNICERVLKMAIRHRKNSLFYKTKNGARVGDIWMTVIHTAELSPGVNPFDYLTTLLKHPEQVRRSPHEWMPWSYQATVAALAGARDPPSGEAPP